ncbi:MAG: hypothetical protein U0163_12960 [Gemmatimonadaceae bacterium]
MILSLEQVARPQQRVGVQVNHAERSMQRLGRDGRCPGVVGDHPVPLSVDERRHGREECHGRDANHEEQANQESAHSALGAPHHWPARQA